MLEEFATELLGLVLHALANVWPPGAKDVRGGARCSGEVGGGLNAKGCQEERKEGATVNIKM